MRCPLSLSRSSMSRGRWLWAGLRARTFGIFAKGLSGLTKFPLSIQREDSLQTYTRHNYYYYFFNVKFRHKRPWRVNHLQTARRHEKGRQYSCRSGSAMQSSRHTGIVVPPAHTGISLRPAKPDYTPHNTSAIRRRLLMNCADDDGSRRRYTRRFSLRRRTLPAIEANPVQ